MKTWDLYLIYDKPVPYKDLLFYPITMRDYYKFHYFAESLQLEMDEKPSTEDLEKFGGMLEYRKKIINMRYLDYLFFKDNQDNNLIARFYGLLSLSLKDIDYEKDILFGLDKNNKPIIKIKDNIYNGDDFDEIKSILAESNLVELPRMEIQKELRDNLKLSKQLHASSNFKTASIEDLIVAVCISTGYSLEYMYDMTIRKFSKMLERLDNKIHYEIYTQATLSGMVEFKDKSFIKHWLSDLTTDDLSDGLMPIENVENKISMKDLMK